MTVNPNANLARLESVLQADQTRVEFGAAVFKEAQEVQKQQGDALVTLLENAGMPVQDGRLEACA